MTRPPLVLAGLAAVFVVGAAASAGMLMHLRAKATEQAREQSAQIERRRDARSEFACVWGRDLDRDRLEDAARSAAQAVGLNIANFDVRAEPGVQSGRSRILTLEIEGTGGFDTVVGFLRLGIFEKPALVVESLRLTSPGGQAVTMQLIAKAECGY